MLTLTGYLVAVACGLGVFLIHSWIKDGLRRIPGPRGLPFFGNAFQLSPTSMHVQLYEMAQKYGPVMKFKIFTKTFVVLNTADVIHEATIKRDTDFIGRPPFPRAEYVIKTDIAITSFDHPKYSLLRRVGTKALKTYGTGVAKMERVMHEVLQDMVEDLSSCTDQPVDTQKLSLNFVSCIILTLTYGVKPSFNDPEYKQLHEMNAGLKAVLHQQENNPILDLYPVLFGLRKLLFRKTDRLLEETNQLLKKLILPKITEAKETYDEENLRGCLDHFIKAQKEELDEYGKHLLDDSCIQGLLLDFIGAGMETSLSSLSQAFLDFLHDPLMVKQIQAEIDDNFEPNETISLKDRHKLPLLEAYVHENLRVLSQAALMLPHFTLRDTQVGGYQIPAGTRVIMNNFSASHNPAVYTEPFECKPERFLDKNGQVVPPGHPAKHNATSFGMGRRVCPGELLAKSRIFLFLAGILQKFDIGRAADLPDRDVRSYPLSVVIDPPPVKAIFTLRNCVE